MAAGVGMSMSHGEEIQTQEDFHNFQLKYETKWSYWFKDSYIKEMNNTAWIESTVQQGYEKDGNI